MSDERGAGMSEEIRERATDATSLDPPTRAADWPIGLVPLGWPEPTAHLDDFLAEVRRLGFEGVQYGAAGDGAATIRQRFAQHGVRVAERYYSIPCTPDGPAEGALERGLRCLDDLDALDGEVLVAAIDGSPDRDATAARAANGPHLTDEGWSRLARLLDEILDVAGDRGRLVSFHPHAGTYIETPQETERLFASVRRDGLTLCLDTGHWIVGGGDPVQAIRDHGSRVSHVHVKDVDGDVEARLHNAEFTGLHEAVDHQVFCTLGQGVLPLRAVIQELRATGFAGWVLVEQDSFRGSHTAAAQANRTALTEALAEVAGENR